MTSPDSIGELIGRLRDDNANSYGGLYAANRQLVHAAADALERLQRERDALAWNTDLATMPKDRKFCVIWRDLYSDNDAGGPTYTTGHTFWNENHWANKPSSHWGPFAWCDFPGFTPPLRSLSSTERQ